MTLASLAHGHGTNRNIGRCTPHKAAVRPLAWAAESEKTMSPATYSKQYTVQVTAQMLHFIDLLAKRQNTSRAEVTRQALREYLDTQEGLIGSRSRMGRTVMNELDRTRNRLNRRLDRMSALLLAAVILQQVQRGESGRRVMEQIVQLARQIEEHLPGEDA